MEKINRIKAVLAEKTYNLTFTAGTLLLNETYAVAEVYLESGCDWEKTQTITFEQNLMAKDKVSTNKRFFSLVKQRISALNEEELDLLVNSTVLIRRQMLLLAICELRTLISMSSSMKRNMCILSWKQSPTSR